MTNVVDSIPEEFRETFIEVLIERDPALLSALREQTEPTPDQREAVDDVFSDEVIRELGPSPEFAPTQRGHLVKRAIEEFWYRWSDDSPLRTE